MAYLTENVSAKCSELFPLLGISDPRTRAVLSKIIEENILVAEGKDKNGVYTLKTYNCRK